MRLCPVWFLQGAIGSIGAIQNHERANVRYLSFLLCFQIMEQLTLVPHTWILLIKALTVHVEPVSSHPGWTEGADTGSHAVALFGDHLQQAGLTCTVLAGHGHRLIYHLLSEMKQN